MKKLLLLLSLAFIIFAFKKKELSWVAIGDSITYLNDHPDETGNRISSGYMTRVTKQLPNIHYSNQGHNGWTATRIADNIEKLGLVKADVSWEHFPTIKTIQAVLQCMVLSASSLINCIVSMRMQKLF
jgi:hypothetical protein